MKNGSKAVAILDATLVKLVKIENGRIYRKIVAYSQILAAWLWGKEDLAAC